MKPKPQVLNFRLFVGLFLVRLLAGDVVSEEAKVFRDFVEAGTGTGLLSDFSYAGYHYSEKSIPEGGIGERIEIGRFGAIPNDGVSDRDAIQAAFVEVERVGGGTIVFEAGEYILDAVEGEPEPLYLHGSNTVLLGKGSGEGGTILTMEQNMSPTDPERMYSTPFIVNIRPRNIDTSTLAFVTKGAIKGESVIEVDSVSNFEVGDWVTLFLEDKSAVPAFFGNREVAPEWKRLHEVGMMVSERHQIASIGERVVRFREPLQLDVDERFAWEIRRYEALEEVGIEGIRFRGGWDEPFVHHRSARDDSAWSCLKIDHVRNSWVRDVSFEKWNYSLRIDNSAAVSVLRVRLSGAPAHFGIHIRRGYGVLIGLVSDTMGNHHGPSVGYQSASTVFWRYDGSEDSSFDSHSTGPYATLLDACSGGWTYGRSGGPLVGMPNHMQDLTIWNYHRTGGSERVFDFWRKDPDDRDRFLEPIIVGFHGKKTKFELDSLSFMESLGKSVEPNSLFEAQLALRLGEFPEFLKIEKQLWEKGNR